MTKKNRILEKNKHHCFIEENDDRESIELVQLRLAVVGLVVGQSSIEKDQFETQCDIFLYVYSLDHLIDRISSVENNPIPVHVVICNDRN